SGDQAETDPICGMRVDPAKTKHAFSRDGRTYYFCCAKCRDKFAGAQRPAKPARERNNVEYTCPMHPEVVQLGPGDCPKCGMALEPVVATTSDDGGELDDMRRRLTVALAFSVPLFVIAMSDVFPGDPIGGALGAARAWVELALATPVVVWCAAPFF